MHLLQLSVSSCCLIDFSISHVKYLRTPFGFGVTKVAQDAVSKVTTFLLL